MIWTTKDNKKIEIAELTDSHLLNILHFIEKKADKGTVLMTGGGTSYDVDSFYCDARLINGQEVLDYYNYNTLLEEAKKRKLKNKNKRM